MSHIKDRLKQYKDKYSGRYKYAGLYVKVIQDMLEQLQDDLEQDEKENGWISVDERLPEPEKYIAILLYNCDIPAIGRYTVDNEGGGTFRVGDQEESFLELDLFVKAWSPLPGPYKED